MKENRYLTNVLLASQQQIQYDENVRQTLRDVDVIAWILRRCVREFDGEELETIRGCILGIPQISDVPVDANLTNMVQERQTMAADQRSSPQALPAREGDAVSNEGWVTFDARLDVKTPGGAFPNEVMINIEGQGQFLPGYRLESRGIYYCSRMISSQLHVKFEHEHYEEIRKVYSIWIGFRPPEYMAGKIVRYEVEPHMVSGSLPDRLSGYDLLSVVIIGLVKADAVTDETDPTVGMLSTLYDPKLDVDEKKRRLESRYGMQMSREMEERCRIMCNASLAVWDRAWEEGMQQGIEQGMQQGIEQGMQQGMQRGTLLGRIETMRELGYGDQEIAASLVKKYNIPESQMRQLLEEAGAAVI